MMQRVKSFKKEKSIKSKHQIYTINFHYVLLFTLEIPRISGDKLSRE